MILKNKKMLTYGLIGIFARTFLVIMIKINIAENKQIFSNPEYSMGELKSYSGRVGAIVVPNLVNFQPKPASVTYSFRVGTSIYFNSYNDAKYIIPSSLESDKGFYVVIYLKSDPKKSLILFNYPVKDSTDFARYLEEFKTSPPKLGEWEITEKAPAAADL